MAELPEKSLVATHVSEPQLGFRHGQLSEHPKDGLFLYGPQVAADRATITIGVIGTSKGISLFRDWSRTLMKGVEVPPGGPRDKKFRLHLSDFPGMAEAFGVSIDADSLVAYELDGTAIERTTSIENHHEAVSKTVDLFLAPLLQHAKNEERGVDVWVFVVPETVFERCRPQMGKTRRVTLTPGEHSKKQAKRSHMPLLAGIIDESIEDLFDDVPDFHRQIKARLLKIGATSQLVRETTIAPENFLNKAGKPIRGTQDPATIAWNLATGLFYKTQAAPPWRLAGMRPGVCYVGLIFKLIPNHPENHACCAAQMFLSEGDGVVFRGANGPWLTDEREFHLSADSAESLIKTVLETYRSRFDEYPKELFIHGTTKLDMEEWTAFEKAAPAGTNVVSVRIRNSHGEMKLFRDGDYPALRGSAVLLGDSDAYLWTSGYAPRIDTYLGPETPNPLFITVLRSTAEKPNIETVLQDILGLTKINYNACNFSDSEPVTIRFAKKVGEVLVMGSAKDAERQPFKYYV